MESVAGVELMRLSAVGRRLVIAALAVGATLLVASAPAHAQLPGGPGAVDQYVEDVPTGSGAGHPTKDPPAKTPVSPDVAEQIALQGGSDAPLLTEIVSSSTYGAPQRQAKGASGSGSGSGSAPPGGGPGERSGSETAATGVQSGSGVVSSAITAVEDGDSRRLLGLLAALLGVSIATVVAVGIRQRGPGRA